MVLSSAARMPGLTLTDGQVEVRLGAGELALVRAALDRLLTERRDSTERLLRMLHSAEQGATVQPESEDMQTLRAALSASGVAAGARHLARLL